MMSEINDVKEVPEGVFPIRLRLIDQYQSKYPSLMTKYYTTIYNIDPFCVGINININLITCRDRVDIFLILKSYVLRWYHMYLLHLVIDIMEAII